MLHCICRSHLPKYLHLVIYPLIFLTFLFIPVPVHTLGNICGHFKQARGIADVTVRHDAMRK